MVENSQKNKNLYLNVTNLSLLNLLDVVDVINDALDDFSEFLQLSQCLRIQEDAAKNNAVDEEQTYKLDFATAGVKVKFKIYAQKMHQSTSRCANCCASSVT